MVKKVKDNLPVVEVEVFVVIVIKIYLTVQRPRRHNVTKKTDPDTRYLLQFNIYIMVDLLKV